MASDANWVEDVRRWYFATRPKADAPLTAAPAPDDIEPLGYEAAFPPPQAAGWPEAAVERSAVAGS